MINNAALQNKTLASRRNARQPSLICVLYTAAKLYLIRHFIVGSFCWSADIDIIYLGAVISGQNVNLGSKLVRRIATVCTRSVCNFATT